MSAKVFGQPGHRASGLVSGAEHRGGLLVGQPAIHDEVSRLVHKLSNDPNQYEDLLQEALLCYWQAVASNPGQTASWYRQRCRFCIHDYLRKGRSVDSLKHNRSACSIDEVAEHDSTPDGDIFQEICERDLFDELTRRLDPAEQRTLRLLREELTLREIAQALHISHVAVIGRRRHIAATAAGLGIHL
jgi:RNA polymerase sigma factor (sigma-70 family)